MSMPRPYRARLTGPHGAITFLTMPRVSLSANAQYNEYDVSHTNYSFPAYNKSTVDDIGVDATFFSDTIFSARISMDAIEFARTAVKMDFNGSGAPPPILKFTYMGETMFKNVPCVMVNYSIQFNDDVDYVPIGANGDNWLPIEFTLTMSLKPVYSPQKQAVEWNWQSFNDGSLVNRGYL